MLNLVVIADCEVETLGIPLIVHLLVMPVSDLVDNVHM